MLGDLPPLVERRRATLGQRLHPSVLSRSLSERDCSRAPRRAAGPPPPFCVFFSRRGKMKSTSRSGNWGALLWQSLHSGVDGLAINHAEQQQRRAAVSKSSADEPSAMFVLLRICWAAGAVGHRYQNRSANEVAHAARKRGGSGGGERGRRGI